MSGTNPIDDDTAMRLRHGGQAAHAKLAAHAQDDPELSETLAHWDLQDAALRALYNPVAEEPVPARHKDVLRDAEAFRRSIPRFARMAAAVALLALGGAAGWIGAQIGPSAGGELVQEAFRAYATYSIDVAHPVEVSAANGAGLTAWLSNRLGPPISPPDLGGRGFHLLGGRVLPGMNGAAVLMMYEDHLGRRITLYVARQPGQPESAFHFAEHDATQGFWWVDDDLGCAIAGNLPRDTLHSIAISAYDQITAT